MKRHLPLLLVLLLPPLASCGGEASGPAGGQLEDKPDVVVFLIDTLRADRTGPGGREGALTPVLDQLGEEGVVFEQAHAAGPWTLPSVVSLFTGRHVAEHNVVQENFELSERLPILPQLLADDGYRCANYHRNPFAGDRFGLGKGFEICQPVKRTGVEGSLLDPMFDEFDSPYFLYVHNAEPHDPHMTFKPHRDRVAPLTGEFLEEYGELVSTYRELTRKDWRKKQPLGTTDNTEAQRAAMARLTELRDQVEIVYGGSVSVADMRVGSVIEKIKQRGRWDETLFIVVSDHGEEMSDHGGWQHDQSVYQELLHVPLIVRFPGDEFAGTRVEQSVSLVDLVPTILDFVGAEAEGVRLSGRSLMPLVRGEADTPGPQVVGMRNNQRKFYRPYKEQRGDVNIAVRDGRWKGILNIEPGTFELYDLEQDPGEQVNVAAEEPELSDRLQRFAAEEYAGFVRNSERATAGGLVEGDTATLEALKALGYIGGEDEDE